MSFRCSVSNIVSQIKFSLPPFAFEFRSLENCYNPGSANISICNAHHACLSCLWQNQQSVEAFQHLFFREFLPLWSWAFKKYSLVFFFIMRFFFFSWAVLLRSFVQWHPSNLFPPPPFFVVLPYNGKIHYFVGVPKKCL